MGGLEDGLQGQQMLLAPRGHDEILEAEVVLKSKLLEGVCGTPNRYEMWS